MRPSFVKILQMFNIMAGFMINLDLFTLSEVKLDGSKSMRFKRLLTVIGTIFRTMLKRLLYAMSVSERLMSSEAIEILANSAETEELNEAIDEERARYKKKLSGKKVSEAVTKPMKVERIGFGHI